MEFTHFLNKPNKALDSAKAEAKVIGPGTKVYLSEHPQAGFNSYDVVPEGHPTHGGAALIFTA